jgi:hypothetical protein
VAVEGADEVESERGARVRAGENEGAGQRLLVLALGVEL